jgi:hypothetical protein
VRQLLEIVALVRRGEMGGRAMMDFRKLGVRERGNIVVKKLGLIVMYLIINC